MHLNQMIAVMDHNMQLQWIESNVSFHIMALSTAQMSNQWCLQY